MKVHDTPSLSYENPTLLLRNSLVISRPDLNSSYGAELEVPLLNGGTLRNIIYGARSNLEFHLSGSYVGQIDSVRGNPVSDVGSMSYPIRSIDISIEFRKQKTVISMAGTLSAILGWTDRYKTANATRNAPRTFAASLTILDEQLSSVTGDELASSIIANRDKYIFGT